VSDNKGFDAEGFYKALTTTVAARRANWKQVSSDTGVSASTLSRMSSGRQPDAASLAALSAWSGLNPSDFVQGTSRPAEPLAMVGKLLRDDPNLDSQGADALEAIIMAAYERFRQDPRQGG
jgi:transcriptional regulator with XRE-family HTH domain